MHSECIGLDGFDGFDESESGELDMLDGATDQSLRLFLRLAKWQANGVYYLPLL